MITRKTQARMALIEWSPLPMVSAGFNARPVLREMTERWIYMDEREVRSDQLREADSLAPCSVASRSDRDSYDAYLNETVFGTARHVQRANTRGHEWRLLTARQSGPPPEKEAPFDAKLHAIEPPVEDILALDEVLKKLESQDARREGRSSCCVSSQA